VNVFFVLTGVTNNLMNLICDNELYWQEGMHFYIFGLKIKFIVLCIYQIISPLWQLWIWDLLFQYCQLPPKLIHI